MNILSVNDPAFKKYGKIWTGFDLEGVMKVMESAPLPEGVIYEPSDKDLEALPVADAFSKRIYGSLPVQLGYCNGHNKKLNALEYHRDSEVNIAVTDMILILGNLWDVTDDFTYETSKAEAFMVPAGTVVEMFSTTLHYAPANADEGGFKAVVILPRGTNYPIDFELPSTGEDALMTATNKWLIAHEEAKIDGAFNGLIGENLSV